MSLLIKNAKIIIQNSPYNGRRMDILIEKGRIKSIQKDIKLAAKDVIKSKNVCVSIGWLDIGAQTGEPGYENRETLQSFEQSAISGGYTGVVIMPNTEPCINTKSALQYFKNNKTCKALDYYPTGAASINTKGEELTEYMDLSSAGAVAFTDGTHSINDDGFMMRSLQYAYPTGRAIMNTPISNSMTHDTHLHEGKVSMKLGMKGSPGIAEKLALQRDIELACYTNGKYIAHKLSTKESCKLVKEAKKRKLKVSATVSYNNLLFIDEDLSDFDTNLKVHPPVRLKTDRSALLRAIKDDTIDAIVSDHQPIEEESKKLEFPYASNGAIGLQTCFPAIWNKLQKSISLTKVIEKITIGPRKILNIDIPAFDIGAKANITIFDPSIVWTFEESDIKSKSKNSPFIKKSLQGKILGVYNNGSFAKV